MKLQAVFQAIPNLEKGDAVGEYALLAHKIYGEMGLRAFIAAGRATTRPADGLLGLDSLRTPPAGTMVVYHHSTGDDMADVFVASDAAVKVVHYHNVTPPELLGGAAAAAARSFRGQQQLGALAAAAHAGIAASRFSEADLLAHGMTVTERIPYAVSEGRRRLLDDAAKKRSGRAAGGTLLYAGRMAPHKGVEDLVAVRSILAAGGGGPWALRLAGPCPPEDHYGARLLELTTAERAAGKVIMAGKVDDAGLAEQFALSDVYLSMSRHEGFCVPLAEAMFAEIPTVARSAGAVAETLDGAGLCIEDDDPAVFAEAVARVCADAVLAEAMRGRQRHVREAYTEARLALRLRDFVARMEEGRPGGGGATRVA